MQQSTPSHQTVAEEATAETQGRIDMPVGESITLAAVGKYLIGLVLAPWLWYERKRVDKLQDKLDNFYTKDEVKEKIEDKLEPMKRDISWIREHLENK